MYEMCLLSFLLYSIKPFRKQDSFARDAKFQSIIIQNMNEPDTRDVVLFTKTILTSILLNCESLTYVQAYLTFFRKNDLIIVGMNFDVYLHMKKIYNKETCTHSNTPIFNADHILICR
jgi:hypothetical protein